MAAKPKKRPRPPRGLPARIVDAAVAMADETGWSAVRLRRVADHLGVPLSEVRRHFRDLDAVADAWFERANQAMLSPTGRTFADLPARQRLHALLLRWFDALAAHRRVTGAMIAAKLQPSHPHHWVPLIFNLSRTIHWLRDAAGLDAAGRRRQIEEIGLSALFLATLAIWARYGTADQERTRAFLDRALARTDGAVARLFRNN